jgi:glucose/mannose transport system permease protein
MILQKRTNRFLLYTILILLAASFLVPAYMVIITAFKSPDQISTTTVWNLPNPWYPQSFVDAWGAFAPSLKNSFMLVIPSTLISAMLGSLNGYVLSKWKFRGADLLFTLMLFGMFIPYQSVLIPLFRFLNGIGLYGSISGLVLTHVI